LKFHLSNLEEKFSLLSSSISKVVELTRNDRHFPFAADVCNERGIGFNNTARTGGSALMKIAAISEPFKSPPVPKTKTRGT
jgi:hypothetical protein